MSTGVVIVGRRLTFHITGAVVVAGLKHMSFLAVAGDNECHGVMNWYVDATGTDARAVVSAPSTHYPALVDTLNTSSMPRDFKNDKNGMKDFNFQEFDQVTFKPQWPISHHSRIQELQRFLDAIAYYSSTVISCVSLGLCTFKEVESCRKTNVLDYAGSKSETPPFSVSESNHI